MHDVEYYAGICAAAPASTMRWVLWNVSVVDPFCRVNCCDPKISCFVCAVAALPRESCTGSPVAIPFLQVQGHHFRSFGLVAALIRQLRAIRRRKRRVINCNAGVYTNKKTFIS